MTDVVIRPLTVDDDFAAQLDLGERAFGPYSQQRRASWVRGARRRAEQGLALGAFIGNEPVGAATIQDMRQFWLGGVVKLAGISGVKVAPEHRGRGIGKQLMTEVLSLAANRGYLLSALYPATTPIYRSFGWELAGAKHRFTIPARSLRPLVAPRLLPQRAGRAEHRAGDAALHDAAGRPHVLHGVDPLRARRRLADPVRRRLGARGGRLRAPPRAGADAASHRAATT